VDRHLKLMPGKRFSPAGEIIFKKSNNEHTGFRYREIDKYLIHKNNFYLPVI